MRTLPSTRFLTRATLLVGALVVSSACATKNDLRDLQLELRRDLQDISARQDSLFEALLATQDATRSTQDATERELMDTRGSIVNELRRISQQMQRIEELAGQNQIAIQNLGQRVDRVSSAGPRSQPTLDQPVTGSGFDDVMVAPGIMDGDPEQDYADALDLYRSNQLFGAQAAFEGFLQDYPQDELVPLVHFYLGDIAEQNEDYEAAIASFERVGELFPDEPRVADANYRIGVIYMELDDDSAARRVFESLIATYGDRTEVSYQGIVDLARDRLEEIGG